MDSAPPRCNINDDRIIVTMVDLIATVEAEHVNKHVAWPQYRRDVDTWEEGGAIKHLQMRP